MQAMKILSKSIDENGEEYFTEHTITDTTVEVNDSNRCGQHYMADLEKECLKLLPCKSWSCPRCSAKKMYDIRNYIREQIKNWEHTRMLTLTLRSGATDKKEHKDYLQEAFRRFTIYIRRKIKGLKNLAYIRVNEMHESGYYHLHILVSKFINQEQAYKIWNDILFRILPEEMTVGHTQMGSVNLKYMGQSGGAKRIASEYVGKIKASINNAIDYFTKEIINEEYFRKWSKSNQFPALHKKQNSNGRFVFIGKLNRTTLNL